MRIRLIIFNGPEKGIAIEFSRKESVLVGRSPKADFTLDATADQHISRNHFIVEMRPGGCRVVDCESRNGTYVNGRKVEQSDLTDGDEIQIGVSKIRFEIVSNSEPGLGSNSWPGHSPVSSFA